MKFVPNAVSKAAARSALLASKSSPKTLFVAGMVGVGATIVLSCKATLKVEEVIEQAEVDLEKIAMAKNSGFENYSDRDAQKDTVIVYARTARSLVRLYGPAAICGVFSVAALAGSHNILTKRNAALAAAYGTIEKAFGDYRGRVRDAYGEEREREIYEDIKAVEYTDPDTKKKVKAKVSEGGTPYSFFFDENNRNWEPIPEYNTAFLRLRENQANMQLKAKGHVFLNEILSDLGFEHTKAGAITGWIDGDGDSYIDFGLSRVNDELELIDFLTGRSKGVWLNFNVDGVIYDKI